ncbi:hypothetical protein ACOJTA_05675 [Malaciobacter sp. WC5094]
MNINPYTLLEDYIEKEKSIKEFSQNHLELMCYVLRMDMDNNTKSIYIQSIGKDIDLVLSFIEQLKKKKNTYSS